MYIYLEALRNIQGDQGDAQLDADQPLPEILPLGQPSGAAQLVAQVSPVFNQEVTVPDPPAP